MDLVLSDPFERSLGAVRELSFIACGRVKKNALGFPGIANEGKHTPETVIRKASGRSPPGLLLKGNLRGFRLFQFSTDANHLSLLTSAFFLMR